MRALLLAGLFASVAACSIPDKHAIGGDAPYVQDGTVVDTPKPLDAPASGPFACLGQPLPTTAPSTFTISGQSTAISTNGDQAIANVTLNGYVTGQVTPIVTLSTDASGNYSVVVPSGGVPIDGHIVATLPSYLTANIFPSRPFDSDTIVPVEMITSQTLSLAAQVAGVTITGNEAQIAVFVVDCNNTPLVGATVQVTTPQGATGTVRYAINGIPSQTATMTDTTGLAFVFNASGGAMTIHATVSEGTLRAHAFTAPNGMGDWTQVIIQP
jgi:hypothetical protein